MRYVTTKTFSADGSGSYELSGPLGPFNSVRVEVRPPGSPLLKLSQFKGKPPGATLVCEQPALYEEQVDGINTVDRAQPIIINIPQDCHEAYIEDGNRKTLMVVRMPKERLAETADVVDRRAV